MAEDGPGVALRCRRAVPGRAARPCAARSAPPPWSGGDVGPDANDPTGVIDDDTREQEARAGELDPGGADRGNGGCVVLRPPVRAGPVAAAPIPRRHEGAGEEADANARGGG